MSRSHAKLSLRIYLGEEIALGPGKADLLDAIVEAGSITEAGKRLGMSYKRAWMLVDTMNRCFKSTLVETSKGGAARGGAELTTFGRDVLERYRAMQIAAQASVRDEAKRLEGLLAR